jgi:hypothetical protein
MRRALLLVLVAAVGCGGVNKADLVGKWEGKISLSDLALDQAVAMAKVSSGGMDISKEQIIQILETSGSSLTLNEDDTYTMAFGPSSYSGKWDLKGSAISLTVEKVNGVDPIEIAKTMKVDTTIAQKTRAPWTLTLADDAKKLTGSEPNDAGTTVEFTRK